MLNESCCFTGRITDDPSDEHVVPQGIGGAVEQGTFVLKGVDKSANSALGKFVDRPFIRSYLIQTARYAHSLKFGDISRPKTLHCQYLGKLDEFSDQSCICDFWQDPSGGFVYHFHEPYPEIDMVPVYSGRPIHLGRLLQTVDPGTCYWVVGATNPVWHLPTYKAIGAEFAGARLIIVNGTVQGASRSMNDEEQAVADRIMAIHGTIQYKAEFSQSVVFADRWLAKTALGMGALLIGDDYSNSNDAQSLRDFLWEKDHDKRSEHKFHGVNFLSCPENTMFQIPDCHTIVVHDVGSLALSITLYGRLQAIVQIAEERSLWSGIIDSHGASYVVCPGLQKAVGPFSIESLLAHQQGLQPFGPLQMLQDEMSNHGPLPPTSI